MQVAQRMERELGEERFLFITPEENEEQTLPDPGSPLTVRLDGGDVHQESWFEVVVGKSMTPEEMRSAWHLSTSEIANRNDGFLNS
jgi:hypothetical protein